MLLRGTKPLRRNYLPKLADVVTYAVVTQAAGSWQLIMFSHTLPGASTPSTTTLRHTGFATVIVGTVHGARGISTDQKLAVWSE